MPGRGRDPGPWCRSRPGAGPRRWRRLRGASYAASCPGLPQAGRDDAREHPRPHRVLGGLVGVVVAHQQLAEQVVLLGQPEALGLGEVLQLLLVSGLHCDEALVTRDRRADVAFGATLALHEPATLVALRVLQTDR